MFFERPSNRQILSAWSLFVFWLILIFIGSSIPQSGLPSVNIIGIDKCIHFIEYLVLGGLLSYAIHLNNPLLVNNQITKWLIFALNFLFILAIIDEVHQIWIPGRSASILDLVADFSGSLLGVGIYSLRLKRQVAAKYSISSAGD